MTDARVDEVCFIGGLFVESVGLADSVWLAFWSGGARLTRNQVDDLMCCLALWMAQHGGRPEAGQVEGKGNDDARGSETQELA